MNKVVSWVSAGSTHSGALTVEGYVYMWGSNSKGQLALGDALPPKQGSNAPLPRLLEN